MQVIPLQALPNQTVNVTLNNQACGINVRQTTTGLYLTLSVPSIPLTLYNVLCLDTVRIVRDAYFGFIGDLAFFDTQGNNNPDYTGLGPDGRYFLAYLETSDLGGLS